MQFEMERPDSGDSLYNLSNDNDGDESPKKGKHSEEKNTCRKNEEIDDYQSPLSNKGFVIVTPSQNIEGEHDDEISLAEWISDRLNKMKIKPNLLSLVKMREDKKYSKIQTKLSRYRSRKAVEETTGSSDDSNEESEFETLMNGVRKESDTIKDCPLWKYLIRQQMLGQRNSKSHWNLNGDSAHSSKIKTSSSSSPDEPSEFDTNEFRRLCKSFKDIFLTKSKSNEHVWVVLITNEFKHLVEIDMLEIMSNKYGFRVLTLSSPFKPNILRMLVAIAERKEQNMWNKGVISPESSSKNNGRKTNGRTKSKSKSKVPKLILRKKQSIPKIKKPVHKEINNKYVNTPIPEITEDYNGNEVILFHKEDFASSESLALSKKEFFLREKGNNEEAQSMQGFYTDSVKSDDTGSSVFEMGEDNLFMCLSQATKGVIPPPVNPKLYFRDMQQKDCIPKKSLVVIVRDLEAYKNKSFSLSRALKEKLRTSKLKSYIITVPNVMKDLQAIQVMKSHAMKIAKDNNNGDLIEGYIRLILGIIADKLKTKKRKVIIVDLGDESPARLWPIKDFCVRSYSEVFTLERLPDEPFESNLAKVCSEVITRYKSIDWKDVPVSKEPIIAEEGSSKFRTIPPSQTTKDPNNNIITPGHSNSNYDCTSDATEEEAAELEEDEDHPQSGSRQISFSQDVIASPHQLSSEIKSQDLQMQTNKTLSQVRERLLSQGDLSESSSEVDDPDYLETEDNNNDESSSSESELSEKSKIRNERKNNNKKDSIESGKKVDHPSKRLKNYKVSSRHQKERNDSRHSSDVGIKSKIKKDKGKGQMEELFNQRPRLLKIHRMPDDSKYPSAISSKLLQRAQLDDEDSLYKGWIAVPQESMLIKSTRTKNKFKPGKLSKESNNGCGKMFRKILKPIGSLFGCKNCCMDNGARVSPEERRGYRGISLNRH